MTADPPDLTPSDPPPRVAGPGLPREVVPTLAARGVLRRRDDVIEKLAPPEPQAHSPAEPGRAAEPESGTEWDLAPTPEVPSALEPGSEATTAEGAEPEPEPEPVQAPPAAPAGPASLEPFRGELGKVADDVIASRAGVSRGTVGAYRRKLGIPAYDGYLFQKGSAPPRRAVGRKEHPKGVARGVARAASRPQPRPGRKSQAEAYLHLLGVETDRTVADRAGVSVGTVRAWRRARGIPAAALEQVPTRAASAPAEGGHAGLRAFTVLASSRGVQRPFFAVARSLADACRVAQRALAARSDGPWTIELAELLGAALG